MSSVEPPTKITWPDPNSEDPVLRLHAAIFNGKCAKIKKIIKSGMFCSISCINYINSDIVYLL